jgi:hypothetical protein
MWPSAKKGQKDIGERMTKGKTSGRIAPLARALSAGEESS